MGQILLIAFILYRPTPLMNKKYGCLAIILFLISTCAEYYIHDSNIGAYAKSLYLIAILGGVINQIYILVSREKIINFKKETSRNFSEVRESAQLYIVHSILIIVTVVFAYKVLNHI